MTLADDIERCFDNGWTDGLPVVPPYGRLVNEMLATLGWPDPTEVIGEVGQLGVEVRAEHLAAAAVMAGCRPEYAPVLRPLGEALLEPRFNLGGVAVTTGGASTLVVVSGQIVRNLAFHCGANTLGSSTRINNTIGRFAGLVRRFCGTMGGELPEFGVVGHPGRISFCIAERHPPQWQPFHCQLGLESTDSAVSIFATEGPNSVNNHYGKTGESILETIADCIGHYGSTNYYYHAGGYIIVLPPEHLALICSSFDPEEARQLLFERCRRSTDDLIRLGRLPRQPPYSPSATPIAPGTLRAPVKRSELLYFLESGGNAGKFSAVIPCWVSNRPICKRVDSAKT